MHLREKSLRCRTRRARRFDREHRRALLLVAKEAGELLLHEFEFEFELARKLAGASRFTPTDPARKVVHAANVRQRSSKKHNEQTTTNVMEVSQGSGFGGGGRVAVVLVSCCLRALPKRGEERGT